MSLLTTKPTKWLRAQQRLRSAWASDQSDQSLRCPLNSFLHVDSKDSDQTDLSLRWAHTHFVIPPTLKKLTGHGHVGFGLSVCRSLRVSGRSSITVRARVLKFHTWIPHGKKLTYVVFFVWVILLSGIMSLWKNQNEILCMPYLKNCAC